MKKMNKVKFFGIFVIMLLLFVSFQPAISSVKKVENSIDGVDKQNQDPPKVTLVGNGEKYKKNEKDLSDSDIDNLEGLLSGEGDGGGDTSWDYPIEPDPLEDLPELHGVYDGFFLDHSLLYAGDNFNLTYHIQNSGSQDAGRFNVSFYLSNDSVIARDDYSLGFHVLDGGVARGETIELIDEFLLPPLDDPYWICDANYYIGMDIDSDKEVEERDEENNNNTEDGYDWDRIEILNTVSDPGKVDLDLDSDNNNGFDFPERSAYEDVIEDDDDKSGKYIIPNNDDDDHNRTLDKLQDGLIIEEDELVPMILEIKPSHGSVYNDYPIDATPWGGGGGGESPNPSVPEFINYRFIGSWCTSPHIPSSKEYLIHLWRSPLRGMFDDMIKHYNDEYGEYQYVYQVWILGDFNGNGELDAEDGDLIVSALQDPESFERDHWATMDCQYGFDEVGDVNGDGVFNWDDEPAFQQAFLFDIIKFVPLRFWIEGILPSDEKSIIVQVDMDEDGFDTDDPSDMVTIDNWDDFDNSADGFYCLPPGYDGDDSDPFLRNWRYEFFSETDWHGCTQIPQRQDQPAGYPMNLAMGQGPTPPDFPPISTDPKYTTTPLISKEVSYFQGPTLYAERPVHNDIIDMMTGQPLVQETDLQLPFGGAAFRYIRTYSEPYLDHIAQRRVAGERFGMGYGSELSYDDGRTAYWDSTGRNWVTSFNPILLVNASYDELGNYDSSDTSTRYCYFIGDAHHTIPFKQNNSDGQFIAPDWFDAILLHNGDNDVRPTKFWLWLDHYSIKYTFNVHYDGVEFQNVGTDSDEIWIDAHDPLPAYSEYDGAPDEEGEGWGFPFYALVEKIEDRYGNTVEYDYFDDIYQWECDDPTTEEIEVCQNANQIGQLQSIKLKTSDGSVAWSLLFVYRSFAAKYDTKDIIYVGFHSRLAQRFENEVLNHKMIHSVYVYDYDIDNPASVTPTMLNPDDVSVGQGDIAYDIDPDPIRIYDDSLVLPSSLFTELTSFDDYDAIEASDYLQIPNDWTYELKYMYEEADPYWYFDSIEGVPFPQTPYYNYSLIEEPGGYSWNNWCQIGHNLLKSTITQRFTQPDGDVENELTKTLYRYEHAPNGRYDIPRSSGHTYLESIFYQESLNTIIDAKTQELGYDVSENIIFELKDDNITVLNDPDTPEDENKTIKELADLSFSCWNKTDVSGCSGDKFTYNEEAPNPDDNVFVNLSYFISVESLNQTWLGSTAKKTLVDNRAGENNGKFSYYLLKTYLTADPDEEDDRYPTQPQGRFHTEYHFPYRYANPDPSVDYELEEIPWDEPFYNMIIDEHNESYDPFDSTGNMFFGIISRRVVQINPCGWVLSDRTWILENGSLVLDNSTGLWEEREYDNNGRTIELRTWGWTSEENQDEVEKPYLTNGLIYKYNYSANQQITVNYQTAAGNPGSYDLFLLGRLRTTSVQQGNGTDQTPYIVQYNKHNVDGRPELVNKSVTFKDPVPLYEVIDQHSWIVDEEMIENSGSMTEFEYNFYPDQLNDHFYMAGLKNKNATYPQIQQTMNGPFVRSVDWTNISDNGNLNWHGYGNIDENGNPAEHFFVDTYEYDEYGRPTVEIIDANEPERNSSAPILELTTQHRYDPTWGEVWTGYPDGCERFIVYNRTRSDGKNYIDQWVYDKVVWHGDLWEATVPVTITRLDNYKPFKKMEVTLNDQFHPDVPSTGESYTVIVNTTVEYDSNGRPISGTREYGDTSEGETEDTQSLTSIVSYHATGQIERSQKADGTITRNSYDGLGRQQHKYFGSTDIHPVWRKANPWDSSEWDDNLVQIEKRYYGNGTNNAGKMTAIRHFMNMTANQYTLVAPADDPQIPENNEDQIGWTTEYEYDGRMRQVVERENSISGSPIKHQVTWYDNLDRARLTTLYGGKIGVPVDIDPRYLSFNWCLTSDTISNILDPDEAIEGILPLSLTETIYNSRGKVQEMRTYDTLSGRDAHYTSTTTFYDHNDNVVEFWSQTSIEKSVYNAKNQLINSSTFAHMSMGNIEMTRTNNTYDDVGQVIKTIQWERIHDTDISELLLNEDNSVKIYMYTWYDKTGRVNYTANYGTNSSSGVYISGDEPSYSPDGPLYYEGALITRNGYDITGRQNATFNPDGTVSRTEFDKLDRQVLVIENADDQDISLRRYTAYYYNNSTGLLEKIAAVLPDHKGYDGIKGIANWSDINWSTDDGSLQITETLYGADVVDTNGINMTVLSFDGTNDYIETTDDPLDMDSTNEFTITAWIKTDSSGCSIVSKFDNNGYELDINEDGTLLLKVDDSSVEGSIQINDLEWHHVVGMYVRYGDSPIKGLSVYVDGRKDEGIVETPVIGANNKKMKIGRSADSASDFFSGHMNEVRVYDRGLSAEEIYILYRGTSITSGLKGYWKMNENYGTIAQDFSGEENDGTIYGATWKRVDKRPISDHCSWISEVRYPDETTGQPSLDDTLKFTYYMDGSIASRKDSKGNTFYYIYDESGQLIETIIDDTFYYDPDGDGVEISYAPQNRVKKISYIYEADGQISSVTTYTNGNEVLSQNNFSYDGMRNQIEGWQAHRSYVDVDTPSTKYEWELSSADDGENFNRLKKLIYPDSMREMSFFYDGSDGLDTALGRISSISVTGFNTVSEYEYAGLSTRISTTLGNGIIVQSFANDGDTGYSGLSQFGQIIDLDFQDEIGDSIHRYQYGYDDSGNRKYSRVTQQPYGIFSHINDQSYLYEYDGLHRLINASKGKLSDDNSSICPTQQVPAINTSWMLDNLGNWNNGSIADGSMIREEHRIDGSSFPISSIHHETNNASQIVQIYDQGSLVSDVVYDCTGNLVFDGDYFYQYDGFNRLIEVRYKGSLTGSSFDDQGHIESDEVGDIVFNYLYDAFGRLIQKEKLGQVVDYYYDGVRRIQEVIDDVVDREYLYGPGYVDEFIGQIDENGDMYYMLQDANYNVMALLNSDGDVVRQYQYDPYGTIACLDIFPGGESLVNRVGHQGLFFENFDEDGLAKDVDGLYYNRNRWYSPTLGRFLSRDPNDAAMPILTALSMNGDIMQLASHMFNLQGHYGDGMNLYQYCGSNPVNNRDPSGLNGFYDTELWKVIKFIMGRFPGLSMIKNIYEAYQFFKNRNEIVDDLIKYAPQGWNKIKEAINLAWSVSKDGAKAFISRLVSVGKEIGRVALMIKQRLGPYASQALRLIWTIARVAAPYLLIVALGCAAVYLGYKFAELLDKISSELAEKWWVVQYNAALGKARSVVASVFEAAANYASEMDLIMYELETGIDVSPYV